MLPDDLIQILRRRPFEPFQMQISDGSTYEVRHPELVMVGLGSISVGIPAVGQALPVYQRVETISLGHIVKLVPLASAPKNNGAGS